MANQWLRLWHDMPTDPKWRTVAKVSGQRVGDVMAVYLHLLVCASNATERGRTHSFNCEDVASALDIETEQVGAIVDAMQGRVLDGDQVAGWGKRQSAREDGSAERAKAWREAKKAEVNALRTQANAAERNQTPDKDKIREEEKKEKSPASPEPFEPEGFKTFFDEWPKNDRKGSRGKCLGVWRAKRLEQDATTILAHLAGMKASKAWCDPQYIPAPLVYLNKQPWDGAEAPVVDDIFAGAL